MDYVVVVVVEMPQLCSHGFWEETLIMIIVLIFLRIIDIERRKFMERKAGQNKYKNALDK